MKSKHSMIIRVCLTALLAICTSTVFAGVDKMLVYIGTYTGEKSKGIYIYQLDLSSGALTSVGVMEGVTNPSFVAIHPQSSLFVCC